MKETELIEILMHLNQVYQHRFPYPRETEAASKALQRTWLLYLRDLDSRQVKTAVKILVVNKPDWPPSLGELLQEVRRLTREGERPLAAGEAWRLARETARKYGYYQEKEGLSTLPARVRETVKCIGSLDTINEAGADPYLMNTFMKIYRELQSKDERKALLPEAIRQDVEDLKERANYLSPPGADDSG